MTGWLERRRHRGLGLVGRAAGLTLLLWSGGAVAAGAASVSARLDFVSRGGCGAAEDLVRRVAVRSARIHLARGGPGASVVRVEIDRAADGSLDATLTFVQTAGRRTSRHVRTGTCAEALDAIALILAVTLDPAMTAAPSPGASASPDPSPTPRKPPSAGSSPPVHASAAKPAHHDPVPPVAAPSRRPPEPPAADPSAPPASSVARPDPPAVSVAAPPPPSPPPAPPEASSTDATVETRAAEPASARTPARFVGSIGLGGQAIDAPAPRVMPGLGAYAILGWDRGSLWSPTLRIAATHSWTSSAIGSAGVAGFQLDLVALDLCPLWLRHSAFGVGACVEASGGRLLARGTQTFGPQTHSRPFGTGGASVIATFEPGWDIEIVASVTGAATLVRDRFQFSPDVFHAVPAFAVTAGVGIGLRFW